MVNKDLELLKYEFEKIRKRGYIKATREGLSGIGKTFEDLLGKKEDNNFLPDYHGIEIKTKMGYTKALITLFNLTIKGEEELQTKRLRDTYGYPDKNNPQFKSLHCSFFGHVYTLVANRYLFKVKVSYEAQKVYLIILNTFYEVLESDCYWDFAELKYRLETKLTYLAFVKAWPKKLKNETYYRYYSMRLYRLKSFDTFLKLIEKGVIRITFRISSYKSGEWMGFVRDRGTCFQIDEKNLELLFDEIE